MPIRQFIKGDLGSAEINRLNIACVKALRVLDLTDRSDPITGRRQTDLEDFGLFRAAARGGRHGEQQIRFGEQPVSGFHRIVCSCNRGIAVHAGHDHDSRSVTNRQQILWFLFCGFHFRAPRYRGTTRPGVRWPSNAVLLLRHPQ
jgi:hypothetical protein